MTEVLKRKKKTPTFYQTKSIFHFFFFSIANSPESLPLRKGCCEVLFPQDPAKAAQFSTTEKSPFLPAAQVSDS